MATQAEKEPAPFEQPQGRLRPALQDEIFAGVRVLEIGQYIAAPVAARMMSDLGAEVLKIELPPYGDMMRVVAAPGAPQGTAYISENRGKKSLCIDLKRPEGGTVLRDLVKHSDVLIENFTPGVLAKYGVTYENLKPLNPRLIMCSISGFGQTGPLANKPGNDLIAQAASGFLNLVGEPDGSPVYPATNLSDNGAGVHAMAAIASALYFRERTGRGQYIDLSLVECMGHYNSLGVVLHGLTGGKAKQTRAGSHSPGAVPLRRLQGARRLHRAFGANSSMGDFHRTDGPAGTRVGSAFRHQRPSDGAPRRSNQAGRGLVAVLSQPRSAAGDARAGPHPELRGARYAGLHQ